MPAVACTTISSISSSMPTVAMSGASGFASGMKWKQVRYTSQPMTPPARNAQRKTTQAGAPAPTCRMSNPAYAAPTEAAAYARFSLCITPNTSVKPIPISA